MTPLLTNDGTGAVLSSCGRYRYRLSRDLPLYPREKTIVWLMFNPSTADAQLNDPTIRKVRGFSSLWGYGHLDVYNVFAYRTTHPAKLWKCLDPIGPENVEYLKLIPYDVPVIAAWGGLNPKGNQRFAEWWDAIRKMLSVRKTFCLGKCKNGGEPRHPLMLPYSTPLEPWTP
jgi:hypothetical protein